MSENILEKRKDMPYKASIIPLIDLAASKIIIFYSKVPKMAFRRRLMRINAVFSAA
jgi:hypothetical protein